MKMFIFSLIYIPRVKYPLQKNSNLTFSTNQSFRTKSKFIHSTKKKSEKVN